MNANHDDRRRTHYVDHILQKWLLLALVLLECTLTALAIWGLYRVLGDLVEDNMYRIHFSPDDNMLRDFAIAGAKILAATGVVNFIAIVLADRIWAVYVNGIVRSLDKVMLAAQGLDLTAQQGVRRTHAVLDRVLRWQRTEGLRLRRIRHSLRRLPDSLPQSDADRADAAAHLRMIRDRGTHAPGE